MKWHKANRRRRRATRMKGIDAIITAYLHRAARAMGLNEEETAIMTSPAKMLYPVLTPLRSSLPRIKS